MAIKPLPGRTMDYWQLLDQIKQSMAATGGNAPQSPVTMAPITITKTNVKTGQITKETIPAGTPVKDIERQAQERLAMQRAELKTPISPVPPLVDIPLTNSELQKIAQYNAQATCQGDMQEVSIYNVRARDKDNKWVTLKVQETNKDKAIEKAAAAGYKPMFATKQFDATSETKTVKASSESKATVKVKDGKTGEFIEFSKDDWEAWPDEYKNIMKTEGWDRAWRAFKIDYYELGDGSWISKSDYASLPQEYRRIGKDQGFEAMQKAFEKDHVKLGDGQWLTNKDYNILVSNDKANGTNFAEIGKEKGYDAMATAIDKANEPYEEFLKKIANGDIIPVPGDQYITKVEYDKLPSGSQQILKEQGFEALAKATTITYEKRDRPHHRIYGGVTWESMPQTITQEEMNKIPFLNKDFYQLSKSSEGRAGLMILSGFIPPLKATLPEYTMADITAVDWGIAAAQVPLIALGFAPAAVSGSVAGKVVTVASSSALSGLIGYGTAKNWASLTPEQRVMGVGMATLCAIPLITTVARNVKISGTPIPTAKGNTIVWKGLSVAGHPIIGRSGGKWVLGTRSITLPEARLILNGYKPETMLETKVFVNRTALKNAGFTQTQIDYLSNTLKRRNLFAGKTSPWLDKDVLLEPTQRLNANEINTVVKQLNALEKGKAGSVKDAYLLYGSSTIKSQLAPELRGWRAIHDWDISLNMNQGQTEAFTQALLKDLNTKGGGTYRISPQSTTLIEKKMGNAWEHIADIHSQEAAITSAMDLPTSKLDATGTYSYGRMVSEPAITVKYPGVGELRIMRLSESGVRKADTILRVRQGEGGTAFKPPERGIAQPGVPKDAADFYVTLRTFQGEVIAEDWLKSWANAMGYTDDWLKTVMKKARTGTYPKSLNWDDWVNTTLKNEMINISSQTPSNIIGYEFKPASSAMVSSGSSPSIIVHIPSSLGASVSASMERQISKPIYPYKLTKSPQMQASISVGISALLSKAPSYKISPSVARSIAASASPKPSPSPSISTVPSPSPKLSPSIVPSISPSGKPSPSTKPSKAPSSIPSTKPSPTPSPYPTPSPKPSPYPYPYPKPGPKPKPFPPTSKTKPLQKIKRSGPPLAVWDQGMYWVTVFPPFRTKGSKPGKPGKPDVVYSREKPPWATKTVKGKRSPQRSLQTFGEVPDPLEVPMGKVIARIRGGRKLTFSQRNGNRKRGRVIY